MGRRTKIKRNIKYIFRLTTRRRVLGMLGLFGGFTYSFLDTSSLTADIGVEKRSAGTPPIQKFFNPDQTGSNRFEQKLQAADDSVDEYNQEIDDREECPYETDLLSKLFKISRIPKPLCSTSKHRII